MKIALLSINIGPWLQGRTLMVATTKDNASSTKHFYNHEIRVALVENALLHVEKRFEKIDSRFDKLEHRMDAQFNKIIYAIGGLAITTIGSLITLIFKIH